MLIRGLPILKEIWMKEPGGAVIKSLFVNNDFLHLTKITIVTKQIVIMIGV